MQPQKKQPLPSPIFSWSFHRLSLADLVKSESGLVFTQEKRYFYVDGLISAETLKSAMKKPFCDNRESPKQLVKKNVDKN